ncbi:MAG: hypothetical protein V3V33_14460 [Candidatus Lokiarchaeia archaeon]
MDKEDPLTWEIEPQENFLDIHLLYRAVHKILWNKWPDLNKIYTNFFSFNQVINGLSVDWSKYATPEDTLNRRIDPNLTSNGIIEIIVGKLRECIKQNDYSITIQHYPLRIPPINRAHSLLDGITKINKAKIKRELSTIAQWAPNMKPIKEQI